MKGSRAVLSAAAIALAVFACNTRPEALSAAATMSSKVVKTDAAILKIAETRCDREVACERVGEAKRWRSRDACVAELGHPDLKAHPCPQGVTQPRLDECLADIGKRSCENAMELVDKVSTCERKALCFGE